MIDPGAPSGAKVGAFERIDCDIDFGHFAAVGEFGANFFADVKHGRFVALALADHAKPRFRDATKSDYRLASSSPGLHWTTDGVPCGFVFSADKSESDNRSVIEGPLIPAPV